MVCEFARRSGPQEIVTRFHRREIDAYREAERMMDA